MATKIRFWDKIYYKEYCKNFTSISSNKSQELWEQVLQSNKKYQENLLVFPAAGLGNRLRVIAAAWNIAAKLKKKVHFYWSTNADIGCCWEDVFSYPKMFWEQNPLRFSHQVYSSKNRPHATSDILTMGFKAENIIYSKNYRLPQLNIYSCWLRDFPKKGVFPAQNFFSLLRPSPEVKKLLHQFLTPKTKKIGLHIRYTDAPIKRSLDWILEWVKYLANKYSTHELVLVSDNQQIKERIIEILPQQRICYQKTNLTTTLDLSKDRTNKLGMQIATADLFALAACEILWANKPNSSFYQAALFMDATHKIIF